MVRVAESLNVSVTLKLEKTSNYVELRVRRRKRFSIEQLLRDY